MRWHYQKQAINLYKQLQKMLKQEFTTELICAITAKTWQQATAQEKEVWRLNAHSFHKTSNPKTAPTGIQNQPPTPQAPTKAVSAHD